MAKRKRAFNPNPGPGAEYMFGVLVSDFDSKHGPLTQQARETFLGALRQAFLAAAYTVDIESQGSRVRGGSKRGSMATQAASNRYEQMVEAYKRLVGMDRECDRLQTVAKRFRVHPNTVRNAIKKFL